MSQQPASPATPSTQTTRLLACGIVAGPLFLAVVLVQAVTRQGFDLGRHPISLLSLGELGWIQITNFVVAGSLMVACAVGMRRVLHPGPGGAWGPLLVGAFGVGLVIAGVFVVDPGAGFPPGAPAGVPERLSWHGILHEVGFGLANLAMLVGCVVFMRRFAARRQWDWVGACVATVVAVLVLVSWPDPDGLSVRLVLAAAILFGFVAALAARLLRGLPNAAGPSGAACWPAPARGVSSAASAAGGVDDWTVVSKEFKEEMELLVGGASDGRRAPLPGYDAGGLRSRAGHRLWLAAGSCPRRAGRAGGPWRGELERARTGPACSAGTRPGGSEPDFLRARDLFGPSGRPGQPYQTTAHLQIDVPRVSDVDRRSPTVRGPAWPR